LLDGVVEALTFLPEIAPEVAVFLEAGGKGFDVELRGIEIGFQFRGLEWSGDGSLGESADGVGGGEGPAVGVLVDIDENAARRTLGDGALVGDEVGIFGADHAGNDFGEGAELLIGVNGLDGQIEVHAGGTGRFQEDIEFQLAKLFMEGFGDGDDNGEFCVVGGIEIEEEIVGMINVGEAAAPGIVVDAAEAGEIEQ